MTGGVIAGTPVRIAGVAAEGWEAPAPPAAIKTYMFCATVTSDWVVGSPIVWIGEWQGRPYEDKGVILQIVREGGLGRLWRCLLVHNLNHLRPRDETGLW